MTSIIIKSRLHFFELSCHLGPNVSESRLRFHTSQFPAPYVPNWVRDRHHGIDCVFPCFIYKAISYHHYASLPGTSVGCRPDAVDLAAVSPWTLAICDLLDPRLRRYCVFMFCAKPGKLRWLHQEDGFLCWSLRGILLGQHCRTTVRRPVF